MQSGNFVRIYSGPNGEVVIERSECRVLPIDILRKYRM